MSTPTPLLEIKDLHTDIEIRSGVVRALSGVDLVVNAGETLGVVGESGSGKTMTALSLMGLLPQGGRVSSGSMLLEGEDLTSMPPASVRKRCRYSEERPTARTAISTTPSRIHAPSRRLRRAGASSVASARALARAALRSHLRSSTPRGTGRTRTQRSRTSIVGADISTLTVVASTERSSGETRRHSLVRARIRPGRGSSTASSTSTS